MKDCINPPTTEYSIRETVSDESHIFLSNISENIAIWQANFFLSGMLEEQRHVMTGEYLKKMK